MFDQTTTTIEFFKVISTKTKNKIVQAVAATRHITEEEAFELVTEQDSMPLPDYLAGDMREYVVGMLKGWQRGPRAVSAVSKLVYRADIAKMTPDAIRLYKKNYQRGWRASGGEMGALDKADMRNESNAWYDGYYDYASRPKWHMLYCQCHEDCP